MPKLPWEKFYFQDWYSDPRLRRARPSSRGIWMDLLSVMVRDHTYYLTMTREEFCRIAFCTGDEFELFIQDGKATAFCHVTLRPRTVTVKSRRLHRKHKARIQAATRKRRQRVKDKTESVTLPSRGEAEAEAEADLLLSKDNNGERFPASVVTSSSYLAEQAEKNAKARGCLDLIPAAHGSNPDSEWDTPEDLKNIHDLMGKVVKETGFNAYKFYTSKNSTRKGKNPWPAVCFDYTFTQFVRQHKGVKNPWPYVEKLWKVHAPNALEALAVRRHEELKKPDPELDRLLKELM
jgi:hypothetical protein